MLSKGEVKPLGHEGVNSTERQCVLCGELEDLRHIEDKKSHIKNGSIPLK